MPLGELASQTLANGVELEAAVAAFQRAMAEIGFPKAEVPTVPAATPETLKAAIVENAKVAAELPRPAEVPPATPETLKAVIAENVKVAAELPRPVEVPPATPETLKAVIVENAKVAAELPRPVELPATPETLKAVIAENLKVAAELPRPTEVPSATPETLKTVIAENVKVAAELPRKASVETENPEASVVLQAAPEVAAPTIAAEVTVKTVTHAAVDGVESVRHVARVTGTDVLVEAAHAVVDTMMVSPGLMRGEGEVRVVLKPEVLAGTELRISASGGTLSVEFMPKAGPIAEFLTANQPQLVQRLAEKIHNFQIAVSVNTRRDGRKERV